MSIVVVDKALASSPVGGAGMSSKACGHLSQMYHPTLLGPQK